MVFSERCVFIEFILACIFISGPQGGFARVYEVEDRRKQRLACKVVTKQSLKTKKAKTKVSARGATSEPSLT